jgi:hypothetical protein
MRTRGQESSSAVGRVTPCAPAFDRPGNVARGATGPTLNHWLIALVLFSTLNLQLSTAHAQTYSIDWSTIDGGGGTSTGGVYSISGTVGQPDAGTTSGGNYSLAGGFWSLFSAVQTPGAPLLAITITTTNTAMISWPSPSTDFVLQQNTNSVASVNWSNVLTTPTDNGTTKTVIVNPATGNRFFRLKSQL